MDMRYKNFIFLWIALFATLFSMEGAPPKWIDIPRDDYEKISALPDSRFKELNALTEAYHSISKTSEQEIGNRLQKLEKVIDYLQNWMNNELTYQQHYFIKNIWSIAKNKCEHLAELDTLYRENQSSPEYLEQYHLATSQLNGNYHPIFLCNRRMYDSLNGQYWGEYWMETADPCHRQLTPYYELFKNKYGSEQPLLTFLLWLEEQNLSKDVPYLRFLDEKELNKVTVKFKEGLLYLESDTQEVLVDYCHPDEEYLFNLNLEGNLLIIPATKIIHHVSLSHGKAVLGCGNMIVKNGLIQSIELESGHYLPSIADGVQVLQILQKLGAFISPSCSFSFYQEGIKYHTTAQEFLASFEQRRI